MSLPDAAPVWAEYLDGRRALRQRARLTLEDGARGRVLLIRPPEGEAIRWPARRVRRLPDQAPGGVRAYGLTLDDPARIVATSDASIAFIETHCPDTGRALASPPLWPRALRVAAAGGTILAVLILLVLPALATLLARFVDPAAEVAMGRLHYDLTREAFGRPGRPLSECRDPAGLAALDRLVARVAQDVPLPYPLVVTVVDDRAAPAANAYAVAGGRITLLVSLVELAETPEHVAAVLAHELGHVVHADPVRQMLQAASAQAVLAVLAGDLTGGGLMGGIAGSAVVAGYSRGAETRADDFALARLTAAGLPPSALGRFLDRARAVWGEEAGLAAHFASHPSLAGRIDAAARASDPPAGPPVLTSAEWVALRGICR